MLLLVGLMVMLDRKQLELMEVYVCAHSSYRDKEVRATINAKMCTARMCFSVTLHYLLTWHCSSVKPEQLKENAWIQKNENRFLFILHLVNTLATWLKHQPGKIMSPPFGRGGIKGDDDKKTCTQVTYFWTTHMYEPEFFHRYYIISDILQVRMRITLEFFFFGVWVPDL